MVSLSPRVTDVCELDNGGREGGSSSPLRPGNGLGQTLPDEAPPIVKIHPFSKSAVTFEPVMRFGCPLGFRISSKIVT